MHDSGTCPLQNILQRTPEPSAPGEGSRAAIEGHRSTALNDRHGYVEYPPNPPLRDGDKVAFGISHTSPTFDKLPIIMLVDVDSDIVSAIRTFFGSRASASLCFIVTALQ